MPRFYKYVGPQKIAARAVGQPAGFAVDSAQDVRQWIHDTRQPLSEDKQVTATFVVDETDHLKIADRRSEHVACAGGRSVLSAGEITFSLSPKLVSVEWVTNQSTGYCPEPESWPEVEKALKRAGISAPERFSREFVFRKCVRCGALNIVKDNFFECAICQAELPINWNISPATELIETR